MPSPVLFPALPSLDGEYRMCIGLDVQRGVHVETMRRIGEPTAPEDFDAKAQSTEVAPQEARGLFLIFIYMAKTPIG